MLQRRITDDTPVICKLPLLDGETGSAPRAFATEVKLEEGAKLRELYFENKSYLEGVICTAWGLVLRCFTGQDDVSFHFRRSKTAFPIPEGAAVHDNRSKFQMSFRENEVLLAHIQRAQEGTVFIKQERPSLHRLTSDSSLHSFTTDTSSSAASYNANTMIWIQETRHVQRMHTHKGLKMLGDPEVVKGEVWLLVNIRPDRLKLSLASRSCEVSPGYFDSVAKTLEKLLTTLVVSPRQTLRDVNYLSAHHEQQIRDWTQAPSEQVEACIHDVVYERALARPEHEAVCAWDGVLTYRELWTHVQQLAQVLSGFGVGAESVIPLCFEKSAWWVVAMLAVLEAGAGFCPLDATQPSDRIAGLVSRLDARILLCSRKYRQELSGVVDRVVPVDGDTLAEFRNVSLNKKGRVKPGNVAYVLWTSGSTGEPKGVVVEHRAYCSAAKTHAPTFYMTEDSRVLQYASAVFDASLVEILTTLMIGATTCIPDEHLRINDVAAAINQLRVNWAQLTPSVVNFLDPSMVPSLKTLLLMGEVMSQEHIETWSPINLLNGYGPAEASVAAVANRDVTLDKEPTLIGSGIGVRCWLVDPENHNRLVPPGCVGEIAIEGATLARGYLNDPDRTNASFVDVPDSAVNVDGDHSTRRMYKTGDLARYRTSDGSLYFLGRKDTQVKVHGQRIELGEIEHHLKEESAIRQSIVIMPKAGFCKGRLVAIISLQGELTVDTLMDAGDLQLVDRTEQDKAQPIVDLARQRLSARLPSFMIPPIWLVVHTIPLLRSGKLDRKTVLNRVQDLSEESYSHWIDRGECEERPASELENQLRTIWGYALNLKASNISLKQSFLSLGGDSISAMMVQSQCKKNKIGITVQDILRAQSIGHLAGSVREVSQQALQSEKIEEPFDLSPIQSLYFEYPRGKGHFNQSVFVRLREDIQPTSMLEVTKTIVHRHSMLRARFWLSDQDDEWKQRITTDVAGSYRFRTHDCRSKEDATSIMSDTQASLDAVNGPLFAVDLFNVDGGGQLLFMTGHHLVVDLVSWRVILQDVEELLTDAKSASNIQPGLPFQTWCAMQVENSHKLSINTLLPNNQIPAQSFAYWGMDNQPNPYGDVRCEGFQLDASATAFVTSKCHEAMQVETLDILIAAMLFSFSQTFTDRPAPTIFNEGHGREVWDQNIDLSRTVGWFTTMYPIHVPTEFSRDFLDVLRRVKDYRRAVPGNGRPYFASRMLTSKGAKRFAGHWPFEFTFNYLGVYQQLEREDALLLPVQELAGEARGAGGNADVGYDTPRFGLFEISAVIAQGQLRFSFTFNQHMKHQEKITSWILACHDTLQTMPPKLAQMDYQPTLTDYPLLSLTYEKLDQLTRDRLPRLGISEIGSVEDIYRCSQIQQGLLISTQRDSSFYAVQGVYRVNSTSGASVDSSRIADAWQNVVNRHASLRTIFVESLSQEEALYDQIVLKKVKANVVRLKCATDADAIEILRSQANMKHQDLTPSHRFTICQTLAGNVFCKLEISHTIIDGTSMSIIFHELVSFYEGRFLSAVGPLYSSYIAFLQNNRPQAGIGYWKSYLSNIEPTIFPTLDDATSVSRSLRSKHIRLDDLTDFQQFCNLHGVTMANIFHTAWALTLRCYTGSQDVSYGYLMSTRDSSIDNVQDLVGYLVNMVVCRVVFAPEMSLAAIMQQVQSDLSDGQAHCQTALSEVLHALQLSGAPLFNTSLSYRKVPLATAGEQHAISFDDCFPYYDPTEYGVSVNIEVSDGTAAIDLDYWTDSLSDGHAVNVLNTFLQAMVAILESSAVPIEQLDTISESDHQQILDWNSNMPKLIKKCVHDVVAERMVLHPDKVAIQAWDGAYTYAELNALSDKLAGYLKIMGIGPESYVCLCFEKSASTIISMLGVLKAGGAFVSLDPMHPAAALEWRIKDTQARVILSSPCYSAVFSGMGLHVVPIDRAFLDRLQPRRGSQSMSAEPRNPCCVIYTSGSTGKPKGVVLEHSALVTSAHAHGSALGIGPETRFLQFSSYTFDNNLEEIFTTLMRGGTVCVPSDHDRLNDLAGAATRLEANFMDLTPTVATFLNPADMPTIKGMALGGEALTKTVLEVWGDVVEIHNQYGPSECSINSAHRTNIYKSSDPSSIGRSVGSVSWIVDPSNHHRLVAIGREGELLIEGPILARGYLNDPEKTSKAFIEDPAWASNFPRADQGSGPRRMYKTGDLVRYNSDGTMSYIGRKDQQVKLHGQRIELGEIEYHVRSHLEADWHFAVELVTPGDSAASMKALALFVCPQKDDSVPATVPEGGLLPVTTTLRDTFKNLEAALSRLLPKHMVPTLFVPIARLPLTSSGKLDRRQLHGVAKSMTENQAALFRLAGSSGREPASENERLLACIWESVLNLQPGSIGMDAQFFRMGGDSIAAIRLVTAARSKNITLTVANVLTNATLSEMCNNASALRSSDPGTSNLSPRPFELLPAEALKDKVIADISGICDVSKDDIEDVYPCTSLQEGLVVSSDKQPGAYVAQNRYRLSAIDLDKFKEAWEAVVALETILRTRIVYTDALGFLQVVVKDKIKWSEYRDMTEVSERVSTRPASSGASLVDYSIVHGEDDASYFVWTIHHALYDGWSMELVLDKVESCYNGSEALQSAPYSRYLQYLSSIDDNVSEAFWKSKLADTTAPQFPALPKSNYQTHCTGATSHLTSVSRESGADITMPSLIRAAWALTISAYTDSEDVVYAETVNGRDAPVSGITEMIGPTFATVPVRIQTKPDIMVGEFLKRVQDECTESMPYQGMGLQRIKRIDPATAKACDFQNLIAINSGALDDNSAFWRLESGETAGHDFFTYALTVSFDVDKLNVRAKAYFDPAVITVWQVKKLFRFFESTLTRFNGSTNALSRLDEIITITDDDETTIKRWNQENPVSANRCIHEVIREKTYAVPISCPAICSWDAQLTYLELEHVAASLASRMRDFGLGARSNVPICFEKSALTVIVMLAILKIGASFVAIDAKSPKARLQSIISDIDAKFLISSPTNSEVCESLGVKVFVLDLSSVLDTPKSLVSLSPCPANSVAYLIFTSGTTGKPKGTLVSHAAFVSGAMAHGPAMRMHSASRVLQFASYTFDASIVEIFTTLMLGGCICIPDERARLNDITKVINEMNVTWALLTPSFVQMIVPSEVPTLTTLVLGGEAMTQNNLNTWADRTHLINAYGPSECAVVATVNSHVTNTSQPSNIGRAVGGCCFIVNPRNHERLAPVGAVGELVVLGPILASGYQKNRLKTEESFVSCPPWVSRLNLTRSQMYKTGDLVKYAEDGSLLYVGRKDNQMKLHGQRLELGEVEHHVSQIPAVKHVLAVIPAHGLYEKKLVAVVSCNDRLQSHVIHESLQVVSGKEAGSHIGSIREALSNQLPPYMVPSNFVMLQEIPLLPSGKLDRRLITVWLEQMDEEVFREVFGVDEEESVVQGSEVEQRLQMIWSIVLHLPPEQIGLDKNFMYLGGDSISALQVSSKCRAEGLGITVQDIIRCRSISDLASRVTLPQQTSYTTEQWDTPFEIAPIQRLFFELVGDSVHHFNQSTVVSIAQYEDPGKIAAAVSALSETHSMLKARFERSSDGKWTQRLNKEGSNCLRFTAHEGYFTIGQINSAVALSQKSLHITNGPLFAADLFESDEEGSQVLALVVHHLAVDVVSWRIILEDLESLIALNKPASHASLPFQVWSRLQKERLQLETPQDTNLSRNPSTADFSYWGMSNQSNVYGDVCTLDFAIDCETTKDLLGPCNHPLQTDIVDILLGCILYSFCRTFPERESIPTVFNEGHGREPWDSSVDVTNTVGWFTTISPVSMPLEARAETDVSRVIRWVKDQRSRSINKGREYFSHRMLAEEASYEPMEVLFNYLGHEKSFKTAGALLQPLEGPWSDQDIGPSVPRFGLFEISASIAEDRLKVSIAYNRNTERLPAIQLWATELTDSLFMASQCLLAMTPQLTLSHFPLLPMDYNLIDNLQKRLPILGLASMNDYENVYSCTPMQRGLLLSQVKDSGQYMYRAVFSISSTDSATPIGPSVLVHAWEKVVNKHSALRTIFVESFSQQGLMDQAVLKQVAPRVVILDANATNPVDDLNEREPLKFAQNQLPHQLTICQSGNSSVCCTMEMSHAICDGTSIPIIFDDLAHFCAESQATSSEVMPYSDYVAHIQQSSKKGDIAYWRQYLDGVEPCYLPALDESTAATRELRTLKLDLQDVPRLQSFCSKNSMTLSNVLQLVWGLVLRTYSGGEDVCFGYLSSGRNVPLEHIDSAVGLFISMLVCRLNCGRDIPVRKTLEQIRDDYAQATNHQGFYLGDLQHELQLSGKSIFNTAFTFQKRPGPPRNERQKIVIEVHDAYDPSEYDITVNVEACETEISVDFNYYTDWLGDSQAKNISGTFAQILHSITSDGGLEQAIGALEVCGEHNQRQIFEWNQTLPPRVDECIHEYITHHSQVSTPSAPAVCSWDLDLTYRELLDLSKRLAKHLVSLGVGPETYVPLCFEKSTWAVVAILGVLFAGGAFVPLEPTHPDSRIKYILNSVDARLVLCSARYSQKFADYPEMATFIVDQSLEQQKKSSIGVKACSSSPDSAAYLIFTSGTTGLPKGTIISHRAFSTSATEHAPAILMRDTSRVLQFSNLCFDASIMEILTTLMTGGCICIPSEEERMNDIPGAINRMSVNWTLLTPSVANILNPEEVPSLQVLVTGGEAMQAKHISKWQGKASLVNAYGPSECAVIATTSTKVDGRRFLINDEPAVIGRAVGCRSWIVDPQDHNRLVPIGCTGELVLEGYSLARGYLNEQEKTAKAFVDRPTWMVDGGRENSAVILARKMYKTGDLVRYKSDGNIIYVSRKDTQIKLNGLRIELGEIEYRVKENLPQNVQSSVAMVAPAGVRQTLAVFFTPEIPERKEVPDIAIGADNGLVLTMSDAAASMCKTLKRSLGGVLPAYMIPSIFVPLSHMPWTTSGKLDRTKLCNIVSSLPKEAMAPLRLANVGTSRAPATELEMKLQSLWESILSLEPGKVTVDDNFFVSGGDSVQAMKLAVAARAERLSLSVLDIFRKPDLSEMAKACTFLEDEDDAALKPFGLLNNIDIIEQLTDEVVANCLVDKDQLLDAYPCTALQEGLITMSTKQPGAYVAHNIFRLPEAIDVDQFKAAWEKGIEDMDILRTRIIHSSTDALIQCVLNRETIEWHSAKSPEDAIHSQPPLPERNGSRLMRLTITDGGKGEDRYFVWSIHHALYDGWSMPKMLQRIEDLYFNDSSPLPKAPYSQFIKYLSRTDNINSDTFWRTKFDGLQCSHFPSVSSTSAGQQGGNELLKYTIQLPEKRSEIGVTLPSIIRAAWAMLMSAHTGSDDVVFGETLTGRDVPIDGIIDMLGPTLTTVPTRMKVKSSWNVLEYLQRVHQLATDVIPFQHVGLQHIRRLSAETATACEFQNLLVIQTSEQQDGSKLWDPQDAGVGAGFFTYPLVVECNVEGRSIHVDAHYNDNVISQWHVQRLLYQLESVLGHLCNSSANIKVNLGELQVISQQDIDIISQWNNYQPSLVKKCIHSLFLQQAELNPWAEAVRAWDGSFNYAELKKHAHNLSKYLRKIGVAAEVLVPVCMDKSRWALVAQLGVLMAGGAIVPFDPAHPVARQSEIIKDIHSKIVVCSPGYESRFSSLVKVVLTIDEQALSKPQVLGHGDFLTLSAQSTNTAYVIFTSGSTGKPKGVVIEHETFCTSSEAYCAAMLMEKSSRVFNFASVTFDVGLMENLSPLTIGACVCMPHNDAKADVASAVEKLEATWAFLTPSVANLIDPAAVPSLKVLVCGGEAMSQDIVSRWADRVSLVNGYGPTEAAVISVANSNVTKDTNPANIGFATANSRAWITDPNNYNRLAPLGCVGELLLGGPILAREYLHDNAKTAAAFIEDPAWITQIRGQRTENQRLYRTGDLVKYTQDGSILFIGRRDNQVKLRGQRMELGEIESKFALYDRIQHGIVMLPKVGICKDKLLAVVSMAHASPAAKHSASGPCTILQGEALKAGQAQVNDVRENMSTQLPTHMMPTIWVLVEAIPILVSGKLDRKQVENWIKDLSESDYQHVVAEDRTALDDAPITETVQQLRDIWASVLNTDVDDIDPGRSFMGQGGDSLTSMSIIARCRKIGINLSFQEVLQSKSLFQLASTLDARGHSTKGTKAISVEEKTDQDFDLSPVQRLYFDVIGSSNDLTREGRFNQSQLLRLTRKTVAKTVQNAIGVIVQQHSMFRAKFHKDQSGAWHQSISRSPSGSYRFREHQVSSSRQLLDLVAESQNSLDLEKGPLFAVELFDTKQSGQVLSLIAHHLIIDVVSWNIVLQQLEDLLTFQTETIEKPLSYQIWCSLQKDKACQRSASTVKGVLPFRIRKADLAYWGMFDCSNVYGHVKQASFQLDQASTELTLGQSNKALQTQPIELFISALFRSFREVFQQRPMPTVFNESHGRDTWDNAIDPTGTTGWFTSIYPIAISEEDMDADAAELLKRVKDLRRSLPANGREYFAHRYLTPDGRWRFGDHMPMEILLNYTGQSHQPKQSDNILQPYELAKTPGYEMLTADVGPNAARMALFEISVAVVNGQANFSFMWNKHMKHQSEIQKWIEVCRSTLKELAESLVERRPEPTLVDFPLLPTTYSGLQKHVTETFHEIGISSLDEVENMYVTAPTQEGLLLSQIRNPKQYVNYVISTVQLAGKAGRVDVQRMLRAWQKVVDRHQSLRTAFVYSVCRGHAFDQIALKQVPSGAKALHCDDEDYEKALSEISLTEVNSTRRPMLPHQLSICTTKSGKTYAKLELNHAVIDGGSYPLIIRDLAMAYEGRLPEGPKPLYSDYVKYIGSLGEGTRSDFWKSYLSGITRCHLPPLNPETKRAPRLNSIDVDFGRFNELQSFCRMNELTLSNVLLASWGLVLRHYTSKDDVCFGNLTAGRDAPVDGIQDTVGAFINMLVCRVDFGQAKSIKGIILNVQSDYLASLPHQHCSLAKVQHDLGFSGKPLFNTAVAIENQISTRDGEMEGDALEIEPITNYDPTEYSVTVNMRSAPGDEAVRIKHWTSHVSIAEAEKLTKKFAEVLGEILHQSDLPVTQSGNANAKTKEQMISSSDEHETSDRDLSDNTRAGDDSSSTSGSILALDTAPPPDIVQQQDYRGIVKDCVNEVLQQMFKVKDLERYMEKLEKVTEMKLEKVTEMVDRKLGSMTSTTITEKQHMESTSADDSEEPYSATTEKSKSSGAVSGILRALWSPLLNVPDSKIKGDDSFLELGGDSILAMELARAAREASLPLTVADIFNFPNLSDMASNITISAQKKEQQIKEAIAAKKHNIAVSLMAQPKQSTRFSLLKAANTDSFIQDYVCPKVGVFRTGIADAFPVTDFQAFAITGSLLKQRWMLNYLTFDGIGLVDFNCLRKAASTLIQHFDILRTVFIPSGNSFLQVVLRSLRPQVLTYETDLELEDYTRQLRDESPSAYPKLGEPYIQFLLVKKTGSAAHRIIIRLSHAQYDGVCLPKIIEAFQAAYEGKSICRSPPFSNYIAEATAGSNTHGQYEYWSDLLQGSSMTHVVDRDQPKYTGTDLSTTVLRKTITIPSLTLKKVTTATILKAAWALLLSQLCSSSDIIFGNLISGRNSGVDGVESIVGPCLNIIPVRIQLDPANTTVLDLLRKIQNQHVAGMEYESLGYREIIQKCTEWPDWTFFSSLVQHQNLAGDVTLKLDKREYKVGFLGTQDTLADLSLVSTPKGGDEVEIAIDFIEDERIPRSVIEGALEALCALTQSFTKNPNGTVANALQSCCSGLEPMPTAINPHAATHLLQQEDAMTTSLRTIPRQQLHTLADTLTRAWRMVLPNHANNAKPSTASLTLTSSFYNQGGDLIALASLTSILESEGYVLRLEELIERPTVGAMVALMWERREKEKRVEEVVKDEAKKVDDAEVKKAEGKKKKGFWKRLMGGKKVENNV